MWSDGMTVVQRLKLGIGGSAARVGVGVAVGMGQYVIAATLVRK
jgi:hypothetical protein